MLCTCNERRSVHKTDLPKMNTNVTIRHTPVNVHIWLKTAFWGVKETTSKMPLHFTISYFLVVLLYVTYVHGTKSATASADIEQLKLNYQHMYTKLQNLVNENQRLNSEVTRLQTRASKSSCKYFTTIHFCIDIYWANYYYYCNCKLLFQLP